VNKITLDFFDRFTESQKAPKAGHATGGGKLILPAAVASSVPASRQRGSRLWDGDYFFVLQNLVLKDFGSLSQHVAGVFWSVLNPLIIMSILTFVFTKIFTNNIPAFPVFLLCGSHSL